MNQLVRTILNVEQYQCRRCGRFFYINAMDRDSLDMDFGCSYGCDDNGRHTRNIKAEVKQVEEVQRKPKEGDD